MSKKSTIVVIFVSVFILLFFVSPIRMSFSDIFLGYIDNTIYKVVYKNNPPDLSVATREECAQIGGKWEKLGLLQKEQCQIYSKDTGKSCFSGFQCQFGVCETSLGGKIFTLGKCSHVLHYFGCRSEIHFGTKGTGLCVD